MVKIALIGFGYWGKNLFRNFNSINNVEIKYIIDSDLSKLKEISKNFSNIITDTDYKKILEDNTIDAFIIATPSSTHFDIAKDALNTNKHVFIEKPMTTSLKNAIELKALAESKNKTIQIDHTFIYTPSIQKIKELINKQEIGNILFFDSTRINLGIFQSDVNVLWDLAAHDLSIMLYLLNERPISLQANGISHSSNGIENIAYLTIKFKSNLIAHFNCSWSSPVKIRMLLIGGEKKMIVYNDLEPTEKLKIYQTNLRDNLEKHRNNLLVDYRTGDLFIPKLENTEALYNIASEFIYCIRNNKVPISDVNFGIEVIKLLEAAEYSIKNNGKEVYLSDL